MMLKKTGFRSGGLFFFIFVVRFLYFCPTIENSIIYYLLFNKKRKP